MKKYFLFIAGFRFADHVLLILCLSCMSACSGSFDKAYDAQTKGKTGQAFFDGLVRLDQTYPNKLALKLEIGARLLSTGDLTGAKTYFDRGEALIGLFTDRRQSYALYADQAALRLHAGDSKEAIAYSTKAIRLSPADELGVVFTRAKAEAAAADRAAALKDFDKGWKLNKASMGAEDYRVYAVALASAGRDAEALQVLSEYQKRYPYETGIGLVESGCYERSGDMGSAILSAFKEYEFGRGTGVLSDSAFAASLDTAVRKAGPDPAGPQKGLERLAASLKAFVSGDWKKVIALPKGGFGDYVDLAARLESGSASVDGLERYILLEASMKSFQAYYYHLWQGMKKMAQAAPAYSIKTARPILEKCIGLSPASPMAQESRRELGRILGIGEGAGERLLVPAEIDAIFTDLVSGGSVTRLDPVMALLDTPDNDYQQACLYALGRISADPAVAAYLAARAAGASGKLRERLVYLRAR